MSILTEVKQHPYVVGGAVIAVIAVVFLFGGSGGAASSSAGGMSDVGAGDALQAAQLAAQTQISGQQTALQGQAAQIGGAIQLANIQAQSSADANAVAASIAMAQINSQAQSQQLHDTLSYQALVDNNNTKVDLASISSNTTIQQTATVANALVQQAQINAEVSQAAIKASSKGLLSRIFG